MVPACRLDCIDRSLGSHGGQVARAQEEDGRLHCECCDQRELGMGPASVAIRP